MLSITNVKELCFNYVGTFIFTDKQYIMIIIQNPVGAKPPM